MGYIATAVIIGGGLTILSGVLLFVSEETKNKFLEMVNKF